MIDGQHDLLRFDAELIGDFFQGVDGGAVDIGLAGFAEAAVVDIDAETFEEAFEGGGAAIHVGGLDGFGDQARARGHRLSAVRTREAGVARVSTRAVAGCWLLVAGAVVRRVRYACVVVGSFITFSTFAWMVWPAIVVIWACWLGWIWVVGGKLASAEFWFSSTWVVVWYWGMEAAKNHQAQRAIKMIAKNKANFEPRKSSASRARMVRAKAIWPVMGVPDASGDCCVWLQYLCKRLYFLLLGRTIRR